MEDALKSLLSEAYDNDTWARVNFWNELVNAIAYEGDSPESDNMDYVCQNNVTIACAKECLRPELDTNSLEAMITLTTMICLSVKNAEKVSSNTDFIKGLVRVAKEKIPHMAGACALTSITNLALHPVAQKNLIACGALDFAISLLGYLNGTSDSDMDVGLTSASFICRVVGKEESGPGPDAIKANTKLVEKLLWILKSVLDAGPDGHVIGYHWDPGNILSDVATLATSDRNKPLLVGFVEQLVRALELRSDNQRAARLAVIALSQLSFESQCKPKFVEFKARLNTALDNIITNFPDSELETKRNAQVLKATINESDKPARRPSTAAPSASAFRRVAKAVIGANKQVPPREAAAPAAPKQHVMISYQWDSQPIAIELEKRMQAAGLKTWFDLNDMGNDINDSMVEGIEGAACVVVLFSRKYKESGNCRKECEMADNLQKPMIFVKVEKDYKQEAWLNLVMGKALWIECSSLQMMDSAFPQIAKRCSKTASQPVNLPSAPAAAPAPAPAPTPAVATYTGGSGNEMAGGEVLAVLKAILSNIEDMKKDLREAKDNIKQLQFEAKVKN